MNNGVFIPIEIMQREYTSKLLLSVELIKRGMPVIIGHKSSVFKLALESKEPGILFYKSSKNKAFETLIKKKFGIVAQDEEAGIVYKHFEDFYKLEKFRVTDERRWNAKGSLVTEAEATIYIKVKDANIMTVGIGNGPVNAIDSALRKALISHYPSLSDLKLTDYKVMILSSDKGTGAITRVLIESSDSTNQHWTTIGVSPNIIDASYSAIFDSITFKLFNDLKKKT